VSHIVLPITLKYCSIRPNHFAFSLSLALTELAVILGLLKFTACAAFDRVLVMNLAVSVWSTVFEHAKELVTVNKSDTATVLKPSIDNAA
jgi:hypothetical protein